LRELAWFDLAEQLHLPLAVCKETVSNNEFTRWQKRRVILLKRKQREEVESFSKQDHYLAQVAAEIRQLRHVVEVMGSKKKPRGVRVGDLLIKFKLSNQTQKKETAEQRVNRIRLAFGIALKSDELIKRAVRDHEWNDGA